MQEGLEVALSRRLVAVPHEDDERDDDCRQSEDDHEHEDVEPGHQLRTLRAGRGSFFQWDPNVDRAFCPASLQMEPIEA